MRQAEMAHLPKQKFRKGHTQAAHTTLHAVDIFMEVQTPIQE